MASLQVIINITEPLKERNMSIRERVLSIGFKYLASKLTLNEAIEELIVLKVESNRAERTFIDITIDSLIEFK